MRYDALALRYRAAFELQWLSLRRFVALLARRLDAALHRNTSFYTHPDCSERYSIAPILQR